MAGGCPAGYFKMFERDISSQHWKRKGSDTNGHVPYNIAIRTTGTDRQAPELVLSGDQTLPPDLNVVPKSIR